MRCPGSTRSGAACRGRPRPGSAWCVWHDPDLQEHRQEWRRRGGLARMQGIAGTGLGLSRELKVALPRAVKALERLTNALFGERLEPQWVRAVALLAEALLEAMGAAHPHEVEANLLSTLATGPPGAP